MILSLLAITVLLPTRTPDGALAEARRLQPTVTFTRGAGIEVDLWIALFDAQSSDALGWNLDPRTLAITNVPKGIGMVFLDDLRELVGSVGQEHFDRALGRVIAHEVEHALRWPDKKHDQSGWYAEALGVEELIGPAEPIGRRETSGGR